MDIAVIDYGSHTFRAGFTNSFPSDEEPRVQTPSIVENHAAPASHSTQGVPAPTLVHPVQRGEIQDYDALESLMHYSLYELLGWEQGNEGTVMVAEPLLTGRRHRELLAQLMFEVFNVQALYCQDQPTLALYAMGKVTGCVVDLGHDKMDVATVTEGQVNTADMQRIPFGGQQLTDILQQLLAASGTQLAGRKQLEALKHMCLKAADSSASLQQMLSGKGMEGQPAQPAEGQQQPAEEGVAQPQEATTFTLPDGQQISITTEGHQVTEMLFDPRILLQWPELKAQPDLAGLANMPALPAVISQCLIDTLANAEALHKRAGQLREILVCGGGSLIPGLTRRLLKQVQQLCPVELSLNLMEVPDYMPTSHALQHAAWLGGAVLARVNAQQGYWVTRADYDDSGPGIVGRKCV